jgi:uncharacterized protein (DUF1684 family)
MRGWRVVALLGGLLLVLQARAGADIVAIGKWRAQRLASLTSETGWLTPVALYWLKEGENTFGRAATNALALDDAALPPQAGSFWMHGASVTYVARVVGPVTLEGKPVGRVEMIPDIQDKPTQLGAGPLRLLVIQRAGHLGVRIRDTVSPRRAGFRGLQYFPIGDRWAVDARFDPYVPARSLTIVNILGMQEQMSSPGAIVFTQDGREWRLDTILEAPGDDALFVMFSDSTSGRETYGAGRFLYIPLPHGGRVRVDFNQSENPPCAFTDFATCPLPPPQNRIALRVDAGELKTAHVH